MAEGKSFRLGDEVRYIQRRLPTAMGASSPLVSLFLFSTETGDAWLLDPSDRRAARLAGDGDPEPVHIEENDTCFVIDWKGNDRIEGPAFIYSDRQTRRVSTILGYVLKFQISLASIGDNIILNWSHFHIAWDYIARGLMVEAREVAMRLIASGEERKDPRAIGEASLLLSYST